MARRVGGMGVDVLYADTEPTTPPPPFEGPRVGGMGVDVLYADTAPATGEPPAAGGIIWIGGQRRRRRVQVLAILSALVLAWGLEAGDEWELESGSGDWELEA